MCIGRLRNGLRSATELNAQRESRGGGESPACTRIARRFDALDRHTGQGADRAPFFPGDSRLPLEFANSCEHLSRSIDTILTYTWPLTCIDSSRFGSSRDKNDEGPVLSARETSEIATCDRFLVFCVVWAGIRAQLSLRKTERRSLRLF